MNAPLYNGIKTLLDTYPMHMPGHKRNTAFVDEELLSLDITEIDGSDNLHHPEGIIEEAQEELARFEGADYSYFLVNGGSSGILTAILGTLGEGEEFIVCRNAHKSVFNACVLSGAEPVYISPDILPCGITVGVSSNTLQEAFKAYPKAKAVLVTSPTYEGFTSDIKALAQIAHSHGAMLIVDETHGAHFPFSKAFPKTAMEQGADISVQSWHKTLPCINQSAVINIQGGRVDIDRIREAYQMVQTTSPSYIMLALMDKMRAMLSEDESYFETYVKKLNTLRGRLRDLKGMRLMEGSNYDIGKIVLDTGKNLEGKTLAKTLLKEYNVQIELAGLNHIIAMTSVADTPEGLEHLGDALLEADKNLPCYEPVGFGFKGTEPVKPVIAPRRAFYAKTCSLPLNDVVGRIAGECVTPFPPDIPLILTGETVTAESVELIKRYRAEGHTVMGARDGILKVIEVNTNGN